MKALQQNTAKLADLPDAPDLFGDGAAGSKLFYLSGGEVCTLSVQGAAELQSKAAPPCGPAEWLRCMRQAAEGYGTVAGEGGVWVSGDAGAAVLAAGGAAPFLAAALPGVSGQPALFAGKIAKAPIGPMVCHKDGDAWFGHLLTQAGPGVFFESYKLAAACAATLPVLSGLFGLELAWSRHWAESGGAHPVTAFPPSSGRLLRTAAGVVFGSPPLSPPAALVGQDFVSHLRVVIASGQDIMAACCLLEAAGGDAPVSVLLEAVSLTTSDPLKVIAVLEAEKSLPNRDVLPVFHALRAAGIWPVDYVSFQGKEKKLSSGQHAPGMLPIDMLPTIQRLSGLSTYEVDHRAAQACFGEIAIPGLESATMHQFAAYFALFGRLVTWEGYDNSPERSVATHVFMVLWARKDIQREFIAWMRE